jgi:hypothetical protein
LAQKHKQRLADQWLALHSSSQWFELVLSGAAESYTSSAALYRADAFVSILGLGAEFEKSDGRFESSAASLGLRLLGTSTQTTSLVARYGWRRLGDYVNHDRWNDQFVEGLLQIYIFRFFGLTGDYRYYFPETSDLGTRLSDQRTSAGAFIEVSIFRVFGEYFWEPLHRDTVLESRDGFIFGGKLMF